nr:heavy metal translocating P-type ATPase [Candidatus Sigynarchaeota archaeon]
MSEQESKKKTTLKISGMTCASCVATIEKSVKNLDGVLGINVNLSTENANLEYDPSKIDLPKIEKTVNSLGYKVVNDKPGTKLDVKIGGMHCANCVTTLEKAIGNINGVASVNVNLSTERAVVDLDPRLASLEDIKKTITDAGYQFLGTRDEVTLDSEKEAVRKNLQDKKRRAMVGMAIGIPLFIMMFIWPASLEMERMYTMFAIATPAFFYTSFPIFKAMLASLKNRSLNMDVMYGMGIGVAYVSSVAGTFIPILIQFMFYDAAVLLAGFLMLGRYLETKAKSKTSDAIKKLIGLQPKTATIIRDGKELVILAANIALGDVILVKPGEKVPADGMVTEGTSYVDEAMITGEPMPALKQKDSKVVGGTINKNSVLKFEAQKVGKDTVLSQIIRLVEEAQGTKPPIQKLADRAVAWFIPVVLTIAIVTFISWLLVLGDFLEPLTRLITILVIACPCALGLATPTAVTVGIGRGAELGILIKNGEVLEKVNKLTTVIFDKTGTLTKGKPEVTDIVPLDKPEMELLTIAAATEKNSQHPLAEAIVRKAIAAGITIPEAKEFDT